MYETEITYNWSNQAFTQLSKYKLKEIFERIENHPLNKYLIYYHKDGIGRQIPVLARPRPMNAPQYGYCYYVCTYIISAFRKVFDLYL
jgi:hypothetical protein